LDCLHENDNLPLLPIKDHSEKKHDLVMHYSEIFAKSMKNIWQCRVYLDLFAGPGKCQIESSRKIVPGSPLIALDLHDKFDKYIFCEEQKNYFDALSSRVNTCFPEMKSKVSIMNVNCNQGISEIMKEIPQYSKNFKVLTFVFIDPCKLDDFKFETIEALNKLRIDVMLLLPTGMELNRVANIKNNERSIAEYFSEPKWKEQHLAAAAQGTSDGMFFFNLLASKMKALGFMDPVKETVNHAQRNFPLYDLVFFSKAEKALKFFREAITSTTKQLPLLGT
jgi:three-Cys-motif partner protein